MLSQFGSTYMLPLGTTRNSYEVCDRTKAHPQNLINLSDLRRSHNTTGETSSTHQIGTVRTYLWFRSISQRVIHRKSNIYILTCLTYLLYQGYASLNRIQSIVYPTAYGSNENMLICGLSFALIRTITWLKRGPSSQLLPVLFVRTLVYLQSILLNALI